MTESWPPLVVVRKHRPGKPDWVSARTTPDVARSLLRSMLRTHGVAWRDADAWIGSLLLGSRATHRCGVAATVYAAPSGQALLKRLEGRKVGRDHYAFPGHVVNRFSARMWRVRNAEGAVVGVVLGNLTDVLDWLDAGAEFAPEPDELD